MHKCNHCGHMFVDASGANGIRLRCPDCGAECIEQTVNLKYMCSDCGLRCYSDEGNCQACGGKVVLEDETSTLSDNIKESQCRKEEADGKKQIHEVLGAYIYPLLCGIWLDAFLPVLSFVRDRFCNFNAFMICYSFAVSLCAIFMLITYYSGNIKFPKYLFYYCMFHGLAELTILVLALAFSAMNLGLTANGDVFRPQLAGARIFMCWLLVFLLKRFRKMKP